MSKSVRIFTISCFMALTLIGLAAITIHWIQARIITQQKINAEIINTSGQQRMLSQRIELILLRYKAAPESAKAQHAVALRQAIQKMRSNQHTLLYGKHRLNAGAPLSSELAALHFGAGQLNVRTEHFLKRAESALNAAETSILSLEEYEASTSESLLPDLQRAVSLYEKNTQSEIDRLHHMTKMAAYGVIGLILSIAIGIFVPTGRKIAHMEKALHTLAITDPLTGSFNRRGFLATGKTLLAYLHRSRKPVSTIILDIDHFKSVNDTHGHACGDLTIQRVAKCVTKNLRSSDVFGRIGGEEFAIFCPNTHDGNAYKKAEQIRAAIEAENITYNDIQISVTVSLGVVTTYPETAFCSEQLLEQADHALYRAKATGRNKVTCYHENNEELLKIA